MICDLKQRYVCTHAKTQATKGAPEGSSSAGSNAAAGLFFVGDVPAALAFGVSDGDVLAFAVVATFAFAFASAFVATFAFACAVCVEILYLCVCLWCNLRHGPEHCYTWCVAITSYNNMNHDCNQQHSDGYASLTTS